MKMTSLMMKLMVVLDGGQEYIVAFLINIVRTNVTMDGEDFNNLRSFEQKLYVEMLTSSTTTKNLRKLLNHWN